MFTVKIWITQLNTNQNSDIEEVEIASEKSLRAAKNQATRWIDKNYFASDIEELSKEKFETRRRATWNLTLKDHWRM